MEAAVVVILITPFLWSAGLAGLRLLAGVPLADDGAEKRYLALMVLPLVLGGTVLIAGHVAPVSLPLPRIDFAAGGDGGGGVITDVALASGHNSLDGLHLVAQMAVALYAGGALLHVACLLTGLVRLSRVVARARRDDCWGEGVRVTDADLPPLAWGRRTILLPRCLVASLSKPQLDMVLRHEQEHLKRGDSRWFATLAWVDAIFWFNPFMRRQTGNCRLAAELACDAAAIAAAPEMRATYAETLVMVLKHAAGDVRQYAPAAFSPEKSGDYRMRISEIMHPRTAPRKPRLLWAGLATVLLLPVGLAQFAWSQTPAADAHALTTLPVIGSLSSGFGMRLNPITHQQAFHPGVDFSAPVGQPVKAAGGGTVSNVYSDPYHMGEVIEIDHGGGLKTRYAHLGAPSVKMGDTVVAGQTIATSGNSGVTTGPHTHFEVWKDSKAIDPATVLPLPKAG